MGDSQDVRPRRHGKAHGKEEEEGKGPAFLLPISPRARARSSIVLIFNGPLKRLETIQFWNMDRINLLLLLLLLVSLFIIISSIIIVIIIIIIII